MALSNTQVAIAQIAATLLSQKCTPGIGNVTEHNNWAVRKAIDIIKETVKETNK